MTKILEARPQERIAEMVREMLTLLGEDAERQGLRATPRRVAKALQELTEGYHADVDRIVNGALFDVEYNEMVLVKDIRFYSLCVPSKQLVNAVGGTKPARAVKQGDRLWTLDRGSLKQTTVTRVTSRKTRDMVEVRTSQGTFRVTPDHPVMTRSGWKEAQELKAGDPVEWIKPGSLCRRLPQPQPGYPLGYVIGATAADGSLQDGRRICLVVKSEDFAKRYRDMFEKAFPSIQPKVEDVKVPSGFLETDIPMRRVRVVSRHVGEKLCRWLGIAERGSRSKTRSFQFPKVVTSSREMMQGFLDGYCDGDGYSVESGGRFIVSSNRSFLTELGRYLQTPVAASGNGNDGTFRVYVSKHWDQSGWYNKHGFRKESDFYVPQDGNYATVSGVRRLPKGKKPFTVYSIQCAPYPTFLVGGHLTHNCEHHLLPFFGKAHVAYVPDKHVVGLSKIPKIVQVFARRLQVQEKMTSQIAQTLQDKLAPLGVGVVIEARHLCMEMRGAESQLSPTVTSAMLGCFHKDARTRDEFLGLLRSRTSP